MNTVARIVLDNFPIWGLLTPKYPSPWKNLGLGFKHTDFFLSSILFKTGHFLGSCLHPLGIMFNVSHSLVNAQGVRIRCSCLASSWGENDALFFKDPSTWRCKISMALSVVIPKMLWCCANAVGPARRHGRRRRRGRRWRLGWLLKCWDIDWNWILPYFSHWELLASWQEDWLMERVDRGSWDFAWHSFFSLQAEG